ncbi:hypothetical protein SDC9_130688 [bioreactor metagenome]|uniref:Poly(Hydroxyalcanoate) granule associated protein (Phasin) n=1 Tax=bioreactor metagenome TaxID=1076179 RepID=A0A645D339_9ZZZZ
MLFEAAKKIFYTGVGLVSVAAEKTGEVVNSLEQKGEKSFREASAISEETKQKLSDVGANVKDVLDNLEKLSREEIERIRAKIPEMEEILSKAESTARVSTEAVLASLNDLSREGVEAVKAKLDELQKIWEEAEQAAAQDVQDIPQDSVEVPAEEPAEEEKE